MLLDCFVLKLLKENLWGGGVWLDPLLVKEGVSSSKGWKFTCVIFISIKSGLSDRIYLINALNITCELMVMSKQGIYKKN